MDQILVWVSFTVSAWLAMELGGYLAARAGRYRRAKTRRRRLERQSAGARTAVDEFLEESRQWRLRQEREDREFAAVVAQAREQASRTASEQ